MEQEKDDIRYLQVRWANLIRIIESQFMKEPDVEAILFLIGVRELGIKPRKFTKEEKVDLMHIAICAILAPSGYYQLAGTDDEGWPHWDEIKPLPFFDIFSQEIFLKSHIIDYFAELFDI